jgi:hypothetical protein
VFGIFCVVGDWIIETGTGFTMLSLAGDDESGGKVVAVIGNTVGSGTTVVGNGVELVTGTGDVSVGGGIVVPNGADIGKFNGAGEGTGVTLPLLSIHSPNSSKPTQSPSNRFEQSKDAVKSEYEIY